ncbi:MAG: adenylate/guanylate cyclase domain-containing protein [Rectinemataceae bacterium]
MKIYHEALETRLQAVAKAGFAEVTEAVKDLFGRSSPESLSAINAMRFARERNLPALRTLRAFLMLTHEGVFDLSWQVHCPHCRGSNQSAASLSDIRQSSHCPACAADYDASFDQNLHLAFRAAPAVADLGEPDPFLEALAGMEFEGTILFALEPGDRRFIERELSPGYYLALDHDHRNALNIEVQASASDEAAAAGAAAAAGKASGKPGRFLWKLGQEVPPLTLSRQPAGMLRLLMQNDAPFSREIRFSRLRKPDWPDAALVSTLREFRNFFSDQALGPQESFEIRNLAILFTDIKGSTAMYERLGDATAFRIVKEHFGIMDGLVAARDGAMIKTIGDAVMAAFHRPLDALAAASDMIDAFDRYNNDKGTGDEVIIKIGVHAGPCIAVNLNDRIDYFGTTVNIAARIQGLSDGRDIMVSRRLHEEAAAAGTLVDGLWSSEGFLAELKGIEEAQEVVKLARA